MLFLLPIAFGGAVGPEAGMSCFAAALATLALGAMRRAGYAVTDPATDPLRAAVRVLAPGNAEAKELRARRRWVRDALWAWCGLGFVAGALLFSHIFGKGEGMPRFAPVDYRTFDLGATVLALAIAFALFTINEAASRAIPASSPTSSSRANRPRGSSWATGPRAARPFLLLPPWSS